MKKITPSEAKCRKEIASLRKSNHTLTVERQGYALRAKVFETMLLGLQGELAKLTKTLEAFMERMPPAYDPEAFDVAECLHSATDGLGNPFPRPAVSRETEGTKP